MDLQQQMILVIEEPRGPSMLIEIPFTVNTQTTVKLPQIQELMSVDGLVIVVKAMRLITPKVLAAPPTLAGSIAPLAELQKMMLTIWCEGWLKGQMIPLLTLNDVADADSANATTIPFRNRTTRFDNWEKVDWNKSTITFAQGTAPAGTPYVVVLEVEYQRFSAAGQIVVGPA